MSPRRTEDLHELGHRKHLGSIVFVGFERCDLGGKGSIVAKPRRSSYEGSTDGLRATHAGCLEFAQSSGCFVVESNRARAMNATYHDL